MRMTKDILVEYAERYDRRYRRQDSKVEADMKRLLRRQRYLTRKELIKIGRWKSPRAIHHYESRENDERMVRAVTKFSFSADSERARIQSLLVLKGVNWPLASTILHFAFPDVYPIMDFRVIESLGWDRPASYTFDFWEKYWREIRKMARRCRQPIRDIEKALWQYNKENRKKGQY